MSVAAFRTRATQTSQPTGTQAGLTQQAPAYITYDLPHDAFDDFDALADFFPATLDVAQPAPSTFDISMYTPEQDATLIAWPTGPMDVDMYMDFTPRHYMPGVGDGAPLGLCTPPLSPASLHDSPWSTPASSPFHRSLDFSMAAEISVGTLMPFADVKVYEPAEVGASALFAEPGAALATSAYADRLATELCALALEDKPRADSGARVVAFADTMGAF